MVMNKEDRTVIEAIKNIWRERLLAKSFSMAVLGPAMSRAGADVWAVSGALILNTCLIMSENMR